MIKYNVGDQVLVRSDLIEDKLYDGCDFIYSMCKFRGKVVTISEIVGDGEYHIREESCVWTDSMFEDPCEPVSLDISSLL